MHSLEADMFNSAQNELYALLGMSTFLVLILVGILAKIYEKSISKSNDSSSITYVRKLEALGGRFRFEVRGLRN